jgi:hypothetical protein
MGNLEENNRRGFGNHDPWILDAGYWWRARD